jgi:anti-sigma regulatory factor (Ser/Thr protein kinase)
MNPQATRRVAHPSPPLAFACDPASGRAVRRHVRDLAAAGGRLELADEAEAVAAELFANAIEAQLRQRVTTVINVQAVVQGGCVVVEVYDHAQGGPFLRDLGREWQTAESGRGMWLVNSITHGAWRCEPWATGKVVVAVITQPLPEDPRVARVAC